MEDFMHVYADAAHQQKKKVKLLQHQNSLLLSSFADEISGYCSWR
jgi:hypothetical protein